MKIKRYFAADMRQAIRQVREEQGADAVILSNKRVSGGVEVVAAIDYDENLVNKIADEKGEVAELRHREALQRANHEQPLEEECKVVVAPKARNADEISWTQEPNLLAMKEEIRTLRGMLEGQLSGLVWGEMRRRHPLYSTLLERLMRLGLEPHLCRTISDRVAMGDDMQANWLSALKLLASSLQVTDNDIIQRGGLVALVGPTGVGKTTTVAKLAAHYTLKHGKGKVALVTTDNYRIGAHQQIRTFGQIIGAPVHIANDRDELKRVIDSLRDLPLVLIDTAGMSQRDMRLNKQMEMLSASSKSIRNYLVLSAATQQRVLDEVVSAFKHIRPSGAILTKMDESTTPGEALSVMVKHRLPVAYISDGQRVPTDLHAARSNNLINRSVKLMASNTDDQPVEEEDIALMFAKGSAQQQWSQVAPRVS